MTVYSLGSITAIEEFVVPRLAGRSDSLTALEHNRSLGGQGVLHSVAIDRAGAKVRHIGVIGADCTWMKKSMQDLGLKTTHVSSLAGASGQSIVQRCAGQVEQTINSPGVNLKITEKQIERGMRGIEAGDWLLLHGETNGHKHAIARAKAVGAKIAYCAWPFDIGAVAGLAQDIDLLILTEANAKEITWAFRIESLIDFVPPLSLVIKDDFGGILHDRAKRQSARTNDIPVDVVDATATNEVFVGYFMAGLDQGMEPMKALVHARYASVYKAGQIGGLSAIPTAEDVAQAKAS